MPQPTISVILPAYNAERFLREAIDSILRQTYKDFELIILNDGSTDKTEEIALSYTDARIRYVKNRQNLKLIKTLNKGIELARGKYIARMDADDISLPNRFEEEVKFLEKHPDLSVVSCYPYNIGMDGKFLGRSSYFCVTLPKACKFVSMFEPSICHPACMFRANAIRKYKYRNCNEFFHIEAYELWNRMFHTGAKGAMIPNFMLYYRDNESSVCHTHGNEASQNHLTLLINSLKKYVGLVAKKETAMCIMHKRCIGDLSNIDLAFNLLDESKKAFCHMENTVEIDCLHEIEVWINQRKLAILMTSGLVLKGNLRIKIILKSLKNISLLMNKHNIIYIKDRIIRMWNEKKSK